MIVITGFVDKSWLTIPGASRRCVTYVRDVVVTPSSGLNVTVGIRRIDGYVVLDVEKIRATCVEPSRARSDSAIADHGVVESVYGAFIVRVNLPRSGDATKTVDDVVPYLGNVEAIVYRVEIIQRSNTYRPACCGSTIGHPDDVIGNMNFRRSVRAIIVYVDPVYVYVIWIVLEIDLDSVDTDVLLLHGDYIIDIHRVGYTVGRRRIPFPIMPLARADFTRRRWRVDLDVVVRTRCPAVN